MIEKHRIDRVQEDLAGIDAVISLVRLHLSSMADREKSAARCAELHTLRESMVLVELRLGWVRDFVDQIEDGNFGEIIKEA